MKVDEYIEHDATGLARLIRSGQVSANEVWQAADGGGSTRIPAALCGLVGLKPNRTDRSFPGSIRWEE